VRPVRSIPVRGYCDDGAQKKEVADYARSRNLEPTIENQRIYRKAHPGETQEIFVEVKAGGANRFDVEVSSK
jgi:hypothetical protein